MNEGSDIEKKHKELLELQVKVFSEFENENHIILYVEKNFNLNYDGIMQYLETATYILNNEKEYNGIYYFNSDGTINITLDTINGKSYVAPYSTIFLDFIRNQKIIKAYYRSEVNYFLTNLKLFQYTFTRLGELFPAYKFEVEVDKEFKWIKHIVTKNNFQ